MYGKDAKNICLPLVLNLIIHSQEEQGWLLLYDKHILTMHTDKTLGMLIANSSKMRVFCIRSDTTKQLEFISSTKTYIEFIYLMRWLILNWFHTRRSVNKSVKINSLPNSPVIEKDITYCRNIIHKKYHFIQTMLFANVFYNNSHLWYQPRSFLNQYSYTVPCVVRYVH